MGEGRRDKGGRGVQDDGVVKEAVQSDSPEQRVRDRAEALIRRARASVIQRSACLCRW